MKKASYLAAVAIAGALAGSAVKLNAEQIAGAAVRIDKDDIGGIVTGPNGREAGVWVIAETVDLPTRFARTVVTDNQGRYVIPDLPRAKYKVWVRGRPHLQYMNGKQRGGFYAFALISALAISSMLVLRADKNLQIHFTVEDPGAFTRP
jgi:hypothetical protein